MAKVVATRLLCEVGNTLRIEIRDDMRVTLSIHPYAVSSTISTQYLREFVKQAEDAYEAACALSPQGG